jgi:6-phospho-beta-glucosidase
MDGPIKLAVLGGSGVATPGLIQALAQRTDRPAIEVILLGRSTQKLERVAALSRRLAQRAAVPLTVADTTDVRRGLEGADYVLNQIRVGGYEGRAVDETFPHAFGLPGEETIGPGGLNNALRTIPVTLELCHTLEDVAPQALIINLTNPSSHIQYAMSRYTRMASVGTCNSPIDLAKGIAAALGAPIESLWVGYVGMHHFGWVTDVRWNGRDVLPDLLARLEQLPDLPVDADLVRATGAIPTSYLKYRLHADRMLAAQAGRPPRAEQLIEMRNLILADLQREDLQELPSSLVQRGAGWYAGIIVPVLLAHAMDTRTIYTLNVPNGSTLPWMPPDSIVELPTLVTRQGFYPLQPARLPPDLQAMLRRNAAMEMLWVEAIVERSYDKALRAIVLDPMIHSLDQARAVLQRIWPK